MKFPDTWQSLSDAGYVFDNEGTCKGCGDKIEWFVTPRGKKIPMSVVEVRQDPQKRLSPVVSYKRIPHWSNCPNAADFRKREVKR